ncbi:hypothetical protein ACFL23_03375 [Patescibacteria group bacterium]
MAKMRFKNLIFFVLIAVCITAFSGCGKKEVVVEDSGDAVVETATSPPIRRASTDEINTSDWKTYRNDEFGYIMKYPENWEIVETDTYVEDFDWHVKNITFYSPNQKYSLLFGLKEKGSDIYFEGRSGFGAVDEIVVDKIININGIDIEILHSIYNDAVREVYYSKLNSNRDPYEYFQINNFISHATLTADNNYDNEFDFRNTEEIKVAEEILESVEFIK